MSSHHDTRLPPFVLHCPRYVSLNQPQKIGKTWYLHCGDYREDNGIKPAPRLAAQPQVLRLVARNRG